MPRTEKKSAPVKKKIVSTTRAKAKKVLAPKKATEALPPAPPTPPQKNLGKKRTLLSTLLGVVLISGAGFGITEFTYYDRHVDTDDAHIDADISPVITRIGGYVGDVRFTDNQHVKQGDTLVVLDGRDYKVKLEQAEAALASTNSSVTVGEANIIGAEAAIGAAMADVESAKAQLGMASNDQEKNAASNHLKAMNARLKVAQKQADTYREQLKSAFSSIDVKKADIDFALLQLSYTTITAPVSGIVSKKLIQPGEYIQPGQSLFSIVNDTSIFVTANFKETQIERMKSGQRVELKVDAYPDAEFEGEVGSFSPATGSAFSLLPSDNATGNFVKVVQRVPVKIPITGSPAAKRLLKPGMNVKAIVSLDR
jgi:membrane fusion protein (multidrug efflux system)